MRAAAYLRCGIASLLCLPALVLPYGARLRYTQAISFFVHLPYLCFGYLARYLVRRLGAPPRA